MLVAGLAIEGGCGGAGAGVAPEASSVSGADRRVERAATRAADAAWSLVGVETLLRHNPADCACPDWEILAAGRWTRVEPRPADSADLVTARLLERREASPQAVRVTMTRESIVSDSGWRYRVVDVSAPEITAP